ncbi:MAG: BON domain-containing protein, partial [Isosphaeraceae bacterium]
APAGATAAAPAVAALDHQTLTRRVIEAMKRRPVVAGQPVQVRSAGDSVSLSGQVASAYEAMMAFRAAQQTPGVREVVDRLEFPVPDENHPNPLTRRGRPEDIEPYLAAQMARHLGDLAHVDTVKARGNHLEVRGTLLDAADQSRVLAILRSIPVLHGFTIDANLTAD